MWCEQRLADDVDQAYFRVDDALDIAVPNRYLMLVPQRQELGGSLS